MANYLNGPIQITGESYYSVFGSGGANLTTVSTDFGEYFFYKYEKATDWNASIRFLINKTSVANTALIWNIGDSRNSSYEEAKKIFTEGPFATRDGFSTSYSWDGFLLAVDANGHPYLKINKNTDTGRGNTKEGSTSSNGPGTCWCECMTFSNLTVQPSIPYIIKVEATAARTIKCTLTQIASLIDPTSVNSANQSITFQYSGSPVTDQSIANSNMWGACACQIGSKDVLVVNCNLNGTKAGGTLKKEKTGSFDNFTNAIKILDKGNISINATEFNDLAERANVSVLNDDSYWKSTLSLPNLGYFEDTVTLSPVLQSPNPTSMPSGAPTSLTYRVNFPAVKVIFDKNATDATCSNANSYQTSNNTQYWLNFIASAKVVAGSTAYYEADKITTPPVFTRPYYTFLGWNTSKTATTASYTNSTIKDIVKSNVVSSNLTKTYYAIWKENVVAVPSAPVDKVYNGASQTTTYTASSTGFTQSGTVSATNVGTYTVKYTLDSNYKWSDGTTAAKSFTWKITPKAITVTNNNKSWEYSGYSRKLTNTEFTSSGLISGHTVTVVQTGETITDVGTKSATISTVTIKNSGGTDVTSNYSITKKPGTLTITKKTITITANNHSYVYDGTLKNNGFTVASYPATEGGVAQTWSTVCTVSYGSGVSANVGTYTSGLVPSNATIKKGSTDVTNNFTIKYVNGTLTITKRSITAKSNSSSKTYDGVALTNKTYTITSGSLASTDQIANASYTGTQTNVGSSNNTWTFTIKNKSSGASVLSNYSWTKQDGTLTVSKANVTVTAADVTVTYGNAAISKCTFSGLPSGFTGTASTTSSVPAPQAAGTYNSSITPSSIVIRDGNHTDVTSNFNVTSVKGNTTITARPITIKAGSASKAYDGTALTSNTYTITSGSLAFSDSIAVTCSGSQTAIGSSNNTISTVTITQGSYNVTSSYNITKQTGTLTISGSAVTVTVQPLTYVYDGTIHTNTTATFTGLPAGYTGTATFIANPSSSTNVGTQTGAILIDSVVVKDANNVDVTNIFSYINVPGDVTITKRPITATSNSATKVYDGTALTNNTFTVSASTPVASTDKVVALTWSGTQTNVGSSENTWTFTIRNSSTNASVLSNYEWTKNNGTLTVTKATYIWNGNPGSVPDHVYDAQPYPNRSDLTLPARTQQGTVAVYEYSSDNVTWSDDIPQAIYINDEPDHTYAGNSKTEVERTFYVRIKADDNYYASDSKALTYYIRKRPIIATSGTRLKVYDGEVITQHTFTIDNSTPIPSPDVLKPNGWTNDTHKDVGTYNNTWTFTIERDGIAGNGALWNYSWTKNNGQLVITKKPITLTWGDTIWPYDGNAHSTTATLNGVVTGDTVTVNIANNSITDVGEKEVTASFSGASAGNYQLPTNTTNTILVYSTVVDPIISLKFDTNGGTPQPAIAVVREDDEVQLPTVTRGRDTFLGWLAVNEGRLIPPSLDPDAEFNKYVAKTNNTFIAQWQNSRLIVHFYRDGTWHDALPYAYVNGTWKQCEAWYYNGTWKQAGN